MINYSPFSPVKNVFSPEPVWNQQALAVINDLEDSLPLVKYYQKIAINNFWNGVYALNGSEANFFNYGSPETSKLKDFLYFVFNNGLANGTNWANVGATKATFTANVGSTFTTHSQDGYINTGGQMSSLVKPLALSDNAGIFWDASNLANSDGSRSIGTSGVYYGIWFMPNSTNNSGNTFFASGAQGQTLGSGDYNGFGAVQRMDANTVNYYKNGVLVNSHARAFFQKADANLLISLDGTYKCFGIWQDVSATTMTAFYNLVQTLHAEIRDYPSEDYSLFTLPFTGTKVSPTAENAKHTLWNSLSYGGLIHFSMLTYNYVDVLNVIPSVNNFNPGATVDVASWVTGAKTAGLKYLGLTIHDSGGFALYDCPNKIPDYLVNRFQCYTKYDLGLSTVADKEIVSKFLSSCATEGIIPICYICPTYNVNLGGSSNLSIVDYTPTMRQYYDNWMAKNIAYLAGLGFEWFWIDAAGRISMYNDIQLYYDTLKAVNPNAMMIVNGVGDLAFTWHPADIQSNETQYSVGGAQTWPMVLDKHRPYPAGEYYIPQELITNGINPPDARWYWPNTTPPLVSSNSLKTWADIAVANNSNACFGIAIKHDGTIDPQLLVNIKYAVDNS